MEVDNNGAVGDSGSRAEFKNSHYSLKRSHENHGAISSSRLRNKRSDLSGRPPCKHILNIRSKHILDMARS